MAGRRGCVRWPLRGGMLWPLRGGMLWPLRGGGGQAPRAFSAASAARQRVSRSAERTVAST